MAEYIDRGTAIAKLTALEVTEPNATMTSAKRLLADMPAADVAPVVRCEDCRFCGFCGEATNLEVMGFYGFCSRGKRKDGGDNDAAD